jgi:hypothetical protein
MTPLKSSSLSVALVAAGAISVAVVSTDASAAGFYLGADAVSLKTDLDYAGGSESYSTTHLRVKGGYEFMDYIAVEAHVLTAADDTDIDPFGNLFSLDTGTIVGIYAKPKTNFEKANVYGLLGLSVWDTTYSWVGMPFQDTDSVAMLGIGVGGEFNITKNLRVNVEGMIHIGSADYNTFFADSVDVYALGLAAGVNYRF